MPEGFSGPDFGEKRQGKARRTEPYVPSETRYVSEERETTWKDVYTQAMSKDQWIYDPGYKEWYSPEEFKARYERYTTGQGAYFARLKIMDPEEGIKAGLQRLVEVQTKLEDLRMRVLTYYKDKAKK